MNTIDELENILKLQDAFAKINKLELEIPDFNDEENDSDLTLDEWLDKYLDPDDIKTK